MTKMVGKEKEWSKDKKNERKKLEKDMRRVCKEMKKRRKEEKITEEV